MNKGLFEGSLPCIISFPVIYPRVNAKIKARKKKAATKTQQCEQLNNMAVPSSLFPNHQILL